MIPNLREHFNARFTPEKHQRLLRQMDQRCGTHVPFRICETPCFFPKALLERMALTGEELIRQLVTLEYREQSKRSIPAEFDTPNEPVHPMFVQVDFGLVKNGEGEIQPRLVELQAFPSLYAYQLSLAESYLEAHGLVDQAPLQSASEANAGAEALGYLLDGLDRNSYTELLRDAIVAHHDPENVILMEIHPREQKTLADFLLTEKMLKVKTVDIVEVRKERSRLYYQHAGRRVPIVRIYNRTIIEDLERRRVELGFDWRDDLDVEWAGHPNWYFRMSKFSIPYLKHESVPKTWFLDDLNDLPSDLENYALKPLFSFAGRGVVIAPKPEQIRAVPDRERRNYILQERIDFVPVIDTPHGLTKAEVRVMYVWLEQLRPVLTIVRMGRGLMMGVDQNKNMEWVGASAALYVNRPD
jgi:hypothetical protein